MPPPCGTVPVAFKSSKLCSGAATEILRPRASWTMNSKSSPGSKPSSDSAKPFCPPLLPWQPPALHPTLVKMGTTCVGKLIGRSRSAFSTTTVVAADKPDGWTAVICAVPVLTGRTTPLASTVTIPSGAISNVASRVRSRMFPDASRPSSKQLLPSLFAREGELAVVVAASYQLQLHWHEVVGFGSGRRYLASRIRRRRRRPTENEASTQPYLRFDHRQRLAGCLPPLVDSNVCPTKNLIWGCRIGNQRTSSREQKAALNLGM